MNLSRYFKMAIERGASDLHLVEGSIPALRIAGELTKIEEEPIPFGELRYAVFQILDKHSKEHFLRKRDIDISWEFFEQQFRVNLHFQQGKIGLTARLIPREIPRPESVGFNDTIYALTHLKDGLVLVTGPSGSGKSTTLAVMIDIINTERRAHIITIEDPIEYVFRDKQSIVEQRQLGRDTENFASALKYALRQDPNVIMVGEMRDQETVQAALAAAKTGHLVLSTLHTATAPEAVERILDFFPTSNQSQVANQLATILRAVIAQQLLPRIGGGLVCAREIMIVNRSIANSIRRQKINDIYSAMQTGAAEGMITMNQAIDQLLAAGQIREEIARNRKRDLETYAAYY
ncbi:PilT/PilU family type 4a pilus ATPase [Candidatus Parcubacteria bacterium]|nr:MAG: PilT/PilU family type 4a pilus ATPase [Candidatus Parcubacteria bacterium]